MWFHLPADSYDTDSRIGGLEQLATFYSGQRVVLVWDGLSSHWRHTLRATWTPNAPGSPSSGCRPMPRSSTRSRACGPISRGGELANGTADILAELADQAQHGIQRVCDSDSLVIGFLAHTGLSLDNESSP